MVIESIVGYNNLGCHLQFLRVYNTFVLVLLTFRVYIENSCVILICLSLYIAWFFSAFHILSSICNFTVLIIMLRGLSFQFQSTECSVCFLYLSRHLLP